jgi:hypothetical protein
MRMCETIFLSNINYIKIIYYIISMNTDQIINQLIKDITLLKEDNAKLKKKIEHYKISTTVKVKEKTKKKPEDNLDKIKP